MTERHLRAVGGTEPASEPLLEVAPDQVHSPQAGSELGQAGPSPAQARRAEAGARVKTGLQTANTCALLAWRRYWDTVMGYVMDPQLRQQVIDQLESDLDAERARAAKRASKLERRSASAEDLAAAKKEVDRLGRRVISEMEIDARTLAARTKRLAAKSAIPAAVILGPVLLATAGVWAGVLAWPAGWAWLALQGRAAASHAATTASEITAPTAGTRTATQGTSPAAPVVTSDPTTEATVAAPAGAAAPFVGQRIVGASVAEQRILERIDQWTTVAEARRLEGITMSTSTVTLDALGICVVLTLGGSWTPERVGKQIDRVRAALAVPTRVRAEVTAGETADEALLRIRTRAPDRDTTWTPERSGIGLDSDTGEVVALPQGRKLIAGTSGSGKSVLVRVIVAAALTADEPTAVVYIDGKGEECALWSGKARLAVEPEEISQVVAELTAEGRRRRDRMRAQGVATWTPTEADPRIVIVVDEGAEVMAMDTKDTPIMGGLRTLARTGRSRTLDVVWCTQKPTIGDGIDRQINGVMDVRAVLRTAGDTETRQVLGPGWPNHTWTGAGFCAVTGTGRGADQPAVQVWDLSDDATVRQLPARPLWHGEADGQITDDEDDGDDGFDGADGAQQAVLQALAEAGGQAATGQLVDDTGYSASAVKQALAELRSAGHVAKGPGHRDPWQLR